MRRAALNSTGQISSMVLVVFCIPRFDPEVSARFLACGEQWEEREEYKTQYWACETAPSHMSRIRSEQASFVAPTCFDLPFSLNI